MLTKSKVFLILAIVGLVVFVNSLHNAFLVDDHAFFIGQKITGPELFSDFIPDVHMMSGAPSDGGDIHYYRPLAHLLPMVSYGLFGNNVVGHHLLNLSLWVVAAWMLFVLLEVLFKDQLLAWGCSLLYLLHPINGVVVNYITADVYSLLAICMLASLYFVIAIPSSVVIARPAGPKQSTLLSIFFSIFFFVLALLCHETAMALPFFATAIFVAARKQNLRQAMRKTSGLWITLGAYFLWRMKYASLAGGVFGKFLSYHMNIFEYLATASHLVFWYLSKLLWPVGIIMIKAQPVEREGMAVMGWLLALVALVAVWAWLLKKFRKGPVLSMGLWCFALGFLPFCFATMFRPTMGMMIEPHWFIFPVTGFFVCVVYAVKQWCKKELFQPVIIGISICLGVQSMVMNTKWDGDLNYCRWWVQNSPGFSAPSFYLAMSYEANKQFDQASYWYKQVLAQGQYKPEIIYAGLGYADIMQNRMDEAKMYLNKALALDPKMAIAVGDLGIIAFDASDYAQAKAYFERAIALDPDALLPRLNLGTVLVKLDKTDEAISVFEGILTSHPGSREAVQGLVSIGMAAEKDGDMDTAKQVYNLLTRLAPHGMTQP